MSANENDMKDYLQKNLCNTEDKIAAARADFGKSMVRLVSSNRAGMGKLKYKIYSYGIF